MKLYHGSCEIVKRPLVSMGRKNLDFGQGFYMTSVRKQAENWAKIIATRKGPHSRAILNIYNFEEEKNTNFNRLFFPEYNQDWLDFIVSSRKGNSPWKNFDIVEGGVANDRVIDTVEDYIAGIITVEQALGQLKYKEINHQICILNQAILDKCLSFEKYEIINDEAKS